MLAFSTNLDEVPSSFQRTRLDDGAWIDVCRSWLANPDALFDDLANRVPWHDERRKMYDRIVDVPRLMCFYEEGEPLPDDRLQRAKDDLSERYREEQAGDFVSTGLCLYRSGRDSVAFHGDRIGRGAKVDVVIAIVSLGATRAMLVRHRGGGPSERFTLNGGDLFVMGGSCQRFYEHSIPKTARDIGARISVQFRPAGVR